MRVLPIVALVALVGCSFTAPTSGAQAPDDDPADPTAPDSGPEPADAAIDAPAVSDAATTTDAPVDAPPAPFVCPADFTPRTNGQPGSKYKIYGYSSNPNANQSRSWTTAQATCAEQGAFLAVPGGFAEFQMLNSSIPKRNQAPYFWTGINDTTNEGTWRTVPQNTPAMYLRWGIGEPDGGTAANCVLGFDTGGADWGMYDSNCGTAQPFACECRD